MKRILLTTAAGLMIAGSISLPAVAQQGRGYQQTYPTQQTQGGYQGGYQGRDDGDHHRGDDSARRDDHGDRDYRSNDRDYRGNDRDDRRGDRRDGRRDDRRYQVSQYHDGHSAWRDTRRHASWNDHDHNGYYVGKKWHRGQPSARDYRQRGFALGYRPWERGDRLGGYNDRYREVDYRDYRVQRPPQGYRWVQDDNTGDLILAALAGGLIATIIANN